MRWVVGLVAMAVLVAGCATDYRFETQATYEARDSGFRLVVLAEGFVPAGSDVSEKATATATFMATGDAGLPSLVLTLGDAPAVSIVVGQQPPTLAPWDFRSQAATLRTALAEAGYDTSAGFELAEAIRAIDGAMAGPKGTIMRGQTQHLLVVEVDSRSK